MIVAVNGAVTDGSAAISAADRGFLLGDGAFETILMTRGAPIFLDAHLARLRAGLAALDIPEPSALGDIGASLHEMAARGGLCEGDAAARVTVSRGSGPRGMLAPISARPLLVASIERFFPPPGVAHLIVTQRRRLSTASSSRFKAIGGYVEHILGRADAASAGADEGVILNEFGRVACASAANIFVVGANARLRTPALMEGALPGIVRAAVLADAIELGVGLEEGPIEPADLAGAELFLTNSLNGLRRARLVDGQDRPPSDIFLALETCYARRLYAERGAAP